MASDVKKTNIARRQHFIARFYLRNFGEPLFSDNLCVYDVRKRRWEKRTPEGVGWFPHLYSTIGMDGIRRDDFDQYLKRYVEDPAAPALKTLATGGKLDEAERAAVAMFIALTATRSPGRMSRTLEAYLSGLCEKTRTELDILVRHWCELTRQPYGDKAYNEFLKPSALGAIWSYSQSLQRDLLQWQWSLVQTIGDRPFVTSDCPVLAQRANGQDVGLVTFPVSSEVALVITNGQFNEVRDCSIQASVMNQRTIARATEFVVACRPSFPGDEFLPALHRRLDSARRLREDWEEGSTNVQ
jgi:hypothetical protein